MDNLGNILSSVMKDENLMNKIKDTVKNHGDDSSSSLEEVISMLSSKLNDGSGNDNKSVDEINETDSKNDITTQNNLNLLAHTLSRSVSKNSALLLALKPYLSKERCQVIDSVIKISQIADTFNLL